MKFGGKLVVAVMPAEVDGLRTLLKCGVLKMGCAI